MHNPVIFDSSKLTTAAEIPYANDVLVANGGEPEPVRAERYVLHQSGVLELRHLIAAVDIPNSRQIASGGG
jgi:hypothetical protein